MKKPSTPTPRPAATLDESRLQLATGGDGEDGADEPAPDAGNGRKTVRGHDL